MTNPVPNENAGHSMEHSAVWTIYDPDEVAGDDLAALKSHLPSSYVVLCHYEGLDTPSVMSNWNQQLKVDSADDERISESLRSTGAARTPRVERRLHWRVRRPGKQ